MRTHRLSLILVVLLSAPATAAEKESALTAEDKKYLDGLMTEFLFDPKGAERVSVPVTVRTVWASADEGTTAGWFVPGTDGKPGRVHFTDGASILAPAEKAMKKIDFKAACKARYAAAPKKDDPKKADDPDRDDAFRRMRLNAAGIVAEDDLATAAWLYRLGDEPLAAKALAEARKGKDDPRGRLRDQLAWAAFAGLIHAYMVRADEEALGHGERLLKLYPEAVKEGKGYRQATQIVDDLKRRRKDGTFGKKPDGTTPDGFDTWDAKRKAVFLITALDEVDARQWGQPGGVNLSSDPRVEELIRLGDPAVPPLIDALETDERLTRSVHFWRDFARSRTVLGVREAALTALMSILRVRVFEPASTGDNFTARGGDAAKDTAKRLRAYWKEYGGLPFDERMMRVLTDPKANSDARREAAWNLATLTATRHLGTTVWSGGTVPDPDRKPNPVIAKFDKPTVAGAILAAMDADLRAFDAETSKGDASSRAHERRGIEDAYLSSLVELGDKRSAPAAAARAMAARTVRERRQWAHTAHQLGDPKPFRAFADDFRAGKVALPADQEKELADVVATLIEIETPEADRALLALADPKHPQAGAVTKQILTRQPGGFPEDHVWFAHPFCLPILRRALDDTTPTGAKYTVEKDDLWRKTKDGGSGGNVPEYLRDPAVRRTEVAERTCDAAAERLAELVVGLPRCHPLFNDADKRLGAMKAAFDRFAGTYRRPTVAEARFLGLPGFRSAYVPDLKPLGRAATTADVATGRAVFHLDGKGNPADQELPAVAVLTRAGKDEDPPRVVVVQAEADGKGAVTYGILSKDGVRSVAADELKDIKSFARLEKEAREAAEKERAKAKEKGGLRKD